MDVERAVAAHPTLERFNENRAQKVQNRIADAITRFAGSRIASPRERHSWSRRSARPM